MKWHDRWTVRLSLRLGGALLLYIAYATGVQLIALGHGRSGDEPAIAYLLAVIAFCSFSIGAALLFEGHHLFDKVPVSKHWMRQNRMDSLTHNQDNTGINEDKYP